MTTLCIVQQNTGVNLQSSAARERALISNIADDRRIRTVCSCTLHYVFSAAVKINKQKGSTVSVQTYILNTGNCDTSQGQLIG